MILFAGIIGLLMSAPGQTIGVSAFTDHLLDALKLTRDQLSISYMGGTMVGAVLLTRAGVFFDKFGASTTTLIAAVGLGIALLCLSQVDVFSAKLGNKELRTMLLIFVGFVFIRFFGQGVLSLTTRTMVVKWFDAKRGLAVGTLSVFAAFGFSIAPKFFDMLIEGADWSMAWIYLAIIVGVLFPIFVIPFFKESPETYGLKPDGNSSQKKDAVKPIRFPIKKDFDLNEVRRNFSFWVYSGFPAMFGLITTGFTFHVVSIFAEQGIGKEIAINIFQPIALVAVSTTIVCSIISDYIKLKYLGILFGLGGLIFSFGLINLTGDGWLYWIFLLGYGICGGIHPLLISLFLPRFFGKRYLGAITGQAMTLVVFCSALGPILFSQSLTLTGDYKAAGYFCGIVFFSLLVATLFTYNPQERIAQKQALD